MVAINGAAPSNAPKITVACLLGVRVNHLPLYTLLLSKLNIKNHYPSTQRGIFREIGGIEVMADPSEGAETRLPLSAEEEKVLALYDKLQELRLEIAILNAQHAVRDGGFKHLLHAALNYVFTI